MRTRGASGINDSITCRVQVNSIRVLRFSGIINYYESIQAAALPNFFYLRPSQEPRAQMSRERLLTVLAALVAVSAVIYLVAFRPVASEGVVDHKTITGTRQDTSHNIVVFTTAGNHFDDKEVRGLFEETDIVNDTIAGQLEVRYDEVFYVVSVRSEDDTIGYFVSRKDFNRVAPGSRIRFNIPGTDELKISIKKVLD